jgi:hypothetical protein
MSESICTTIVDVRHRKVLVTAKNFEVTNRENLDFGAQIALECKCKRDEEESRRNNL